MRTVPAVRVSSALAHLVKEDGMPVKGIASIVQAAAEDAAGVASAAEAGKKTVVVEVGEMGEGIAAIQAARGCGLRTLALLREELIAKSCFDLKLHSAQLGDAGADAVLLSVKDSLSKDDLCNMAAGVLAAADVSGEQPIEGRLGLHVAPGGGALDLIRYAHNELRFLHFLSCLAGKHAPRPSEVLEALGTRRSDAAFGPIFLAEHVPDAA
jgi:hypothetical protein